jgi:hypothetical protein
MVIAPAVLGSENDCAGEDPAVFVNDRPLLSSEGMLHKEYDRKCLVGK